MISAQRYCWLTCGYAPLTCVLAFGLAGCNASIAPATPPARIHDAGLSSYTQTQSDTDGCAPAFNAKLASLIASPPQQDIDNVGVCGISVRPSRTQRGGEHGDHQVISVRATMPSGQQYLVEVVTNDDLDGIVTANPNDTVTAFGQAFIPSHGKYAAGIHDVHCSTHRGAENGYVIVDGRRFPATCPPVGEFRGDRRHSRNTGEYASF